MTRSLASLVAAGLACCLAPAALAQDAFPAWVALFTAAQTGWLENENRLGELCTEPGTLAECHVQKLGPMVSAYELHAGPSDVSPRVGELIVVAVPGRGLSASFRPAGSPEVVPFTPDLYLQDWGYGPYFHQTVSAVRGDWVQLPPDPWPQAVWLHRADGGEPSSIIPVQAGDIIEMRGAGWYVLAAEPDTLVLRAEQPADLWCEEGNPPAITPAVPISRTRPQLVDARGHLAFRLKYLKGC